MMPTGYPDIPSGADLSPRLSGLAPHLAAYLTKMRKERGRGPNDAIRAEDLCRWFESFHHETLTDVDIRAMVNALRRARRPIGSGANGYFWAVNRNELGRVKRQLEDRINALRAAIDGLENAVFDGGEALI